MRRRNIGLALRWPVLGLGLVAFGVLLLPGPQLSRANADDGGPPIIRVEEDWALVLNEPGSEINAPQFHTVMCPYQQAESVYAQVSWNYRESPEFEAGGLQLQAWNGEDAVDEMSAGELSLSRDAETITWTQRLETNGSQLTFKIVNGQSQSWGSFGGDSTRVNLNAAVSDLAGYSPQVSKRNSWVTYGSNRVNLLVITEVRRYGPDGLVSQDSTPIVVYRFVDELMEE